MIDKRTGFLAQIASLTIDRVAREKLVVDETELRDRIAKAARVPHDFLKALRDGKGIIAEIKRKSPSKGAIAPELDPVKVAAEYLTNGASAISILTEPSHFGGEVADLAAVRAAYPQASLLMKDFMLDSYQLLQARAYGADAVLLIVAFLDQEQLQKLFDEALALGLTPLFEVHDEAELTTALDMGAKLIGVNNRDLRTLQTDIEISRRLAKSKREGVLLVSESGIDSRGTIDELRALGFEGFLIGTALMQGKTPGPSLRVLTDS